MAQDNLRSTETGLLRSLTAAAPHGFNGSQRGPISCCSSNNRIPFANRNGEKTGEFPIGSVLVAIGDQGCAALIRAHQHGLGVLMRPVSTAAEVGLRRANG